MSSLLGWFKKLFGATNTTTTGTTKTTTRNDNSSQKKYALCMGLNDYPGTGNDLNGCVPDANNWANLFKQTFNFAKVYTLLNEQVTSSNFVASIKNIASEVKPDDSVVISYSGHGSTMADTSGDEVDNKDECWCFHDKFFSDDDIRKALSLFPVGVRLTILSDSCHSGTVTREFLNVMNNNEESKPRYMPPRYTEDAFTINALPVNNAVFVPDEDMNEVLLSGCKSTEYSYDARINGQATGAFTYYSINIIKNNPSITYSELYKQLRAMLPSNSYPQTPQLEGSEANKNRPVFS